MKNLLTLLLAFMLAACSSSGNKETALQDSTAMNDTLDVAALPDEEPIKETEVEPGDTSQLLIRFDETAGLIYERHDLFHTVSIVSKQYEAYTDVTWYFDADLSPVYYKENWGSEGNEGSTEFFIADGHVQCSYTEGSNVVEKWCRSTGGTKVTWDDETGEATVELLEADYDNTCDEELARYLRVLRTLLDVGEIKEEDENSYTIHLEKTVDVGFMFTETSDISIPKEVYKSVKSQ